VARLRAVAHVHGLPLDARSVTDEIVAREEGREPSAASAPGAGALTGGGVERAVD
jgi:hypothetical protein